MRLTKSTIKGGTAIWGRKTGKTFLIRNFVRHTHYFFVERGGPILSEKTDGFTKSDPPIVDLFYHLDTKYGVSELRNEEIMISPEVDAIITVGSKAVCCAEIKMKTGKNDLKKLKAKTEEIECDKLVVDRNSLKDLLT